ncbi:MAG TPA: sugar nucleotide-binding protein [Flavobacteriaceae bacterium]|nr:sugar nucleotide-binding protein [Flavobacteriaceae bacterium]
MILGASGFLGNVLYKELQAYFDVHGTYSTKTHFRKNKKFHAWDLEKEPLAPLLKNLKPNIVVSALRGSFQAQIHAHQEIIDFLTRSDGKLIFLSSANVFDAFTNYPSYEFDKTLSDSVYGRFKIKIENALLRLPSEKYVIARLPMVFGANSPRVQEIKQLAGLHEAIEVFPNVVINAASHQKLSQQIHFIINQGKHGIFHLGSKDLVHHHELIEDICKQLKIESPIFKRAYSSNEDRFLAVLPKDRLLPQNLQTTIAEIVGHCALKNC